MKKVLMILGHPQRESYGAALAEAYANGVKQSQGELRELFLGDLDFEFAPANAFARADDLEPDIEAAQAAIAWADHLVFVYPTLWGTIPALLKAFIERSFLPGFAFQPHKDSVWWDKLLKGKSARLIVTMNTPRWIYRWVFGKPGHNTMKRSILNFCGVAPVRITSLGPVARSSARQRERWLQRVQRLGRRLR